MIENQIDRMSGRYGEDTIVGNVAFVPPVGLCIGSLTVRSGGATIQALKKTVEGVESDVAANVESTFKSPALLLEPGEWKTFINDITSIQLTGATDSVTVWFKPI